MAVDNRGALRSFRSVAGVRSVRAASLIAASVAMAAGIASAQYRVDNSQVNDASNRIGSGGFNGGVANPYAARGFNNGNLIVTGNVSSGRQFRGSLGYTAPTQFRGNLGSADFDRFIGDSVGVGQVREAPRSVFANQGTVVRPYFGPGQTVERPAGFVQSPGIQGGYVPAGPRTVLSNDGRIDYGGATRAQVASGVLSEATVIGGAGLPTTPAGALMARQQLNVSEYTALSRPRTDGPGDLFEAARDGRAEVSDAATPDAATPPGTTPEGASPQNANPLLGLPTDAATPGQPADGQPNADRPSADAAARTGQNLSLRTQMNRTDGSQYGQLRERFQQRQQSRLPNAEAIEQSRRYNEQVLRNRAEAAKTDAPADGRRPDAATPDANAPTPSNPARPTPGAAPQDGLNLPRPAEQPAPAAPAAAPEGPMEIKSLATGVADPNLKRTLGEAEALMKAGKFTSAIDAYDRAEAMATSDPLVFVGRGIAELGGGYYRNAETHFRQAFAGDRSLLLGRYDLNELLTKDRLNYLLDDLGRVANANKNDPGPLVLLAFVYYNANLPDRAARALDLADQRAGGKDELVKLFRENWTLPETGGNK